MKTKSKIAELEASLAEAVAKVEAYRERDLIDENNRIVAARKKALESIENGNIPLSVLRGLIQRTTRYGDGDLSIELEYDHSRTYDRDGTIRATLKALTSA